MPQSKLDPTLTTSSIPSSPRTQDTEPAPRSSSCDGETLAPALASAPALSGSGSLASDPTLPVVPVARRSLPAGQRGPKPTRERNRGSAQPHGSGRRFNSRHRG